MSTTDTTPTALRALAAQIKRGGFPGNSFWMPVMDALFAVAAEKETQAAERKELISAFESHIRTLQNRLTEKEAQAVPVGYQAVLNGGQFGTHIAQQDDVDYWADKGIEHRPLYAAPKAQAVPQGWQLVPVEPTTDMEDAAEKAETRHQVEDRRRGGHDPQLAFRNVYRAMLAAAPQAPEASPWLPIDSCPMDTLVFLYGAKRLDMAVGMRHSRDGWVTDTSSEWASMYPPTHWMPLPAGPKA